MLPTRTLFQATTSTSTSTASKSKYIPAFSFTGITGIVAHPFPRPVLISLYAHTLNVLSSLPSHSIYRISTENLTKSRLALVESITPPGYEEYSAKIAPLQERYRQLLIGKGSPGNSVEKEIRLKAAVANAQIRASVKKVTDDYIASEISEEDTEATKVDFETRMEEIERALGRIPDASPGDNKALPDAKKQAHDAILPQQTKDQANAHPGENTLGGSDPSIPPPGSVASSGSTSSLPEIPPEPLLTVDQIAELENKIGAGLIEEVINQGFAELKLVEEMKKCKPWEELEEAPIEGQWAYFERKT